MCTTESGSGGVSDVIFNPPTQDPFFRDAHYLREWPDGNVGKRGPSFEIWLIFNCPWFTSVLQNLLSISVFKCAWSACLPASVGDLFFTTFLVQFAGSSFTDFILWDHVCILLLFILIRLSPCLLAPSSVTSSVTSSVLLLAQAQGFPAVNVECWKTVCVCWFRTSGSMDTITINTSATPRITASRFPWTQTTSHAKREALVFNFTSDRLLSLNFDVNGPIRSFLSWRLCSQGFAFTIFFHCTLFCWCKRLARVKIQF